MRTDHAASVSGQALMSHDCVPNVTGPCRPATVWRADQAVAEVNAFEDITPDVFDVIEEDASKTRYMRLGGRRTCR